MHLILKALTLAVMLLSDVMLAAAAPVEGPEIEQTSLRRFNSVESSIIAAERTLSSKNGLHHGLVERKETSSIARPSNAFSDAGYVIQRLPDTGLSVAFYRVGAAPSWMVQRVLHKTMVSASQHNPLATTAVFSYFPREAHLEIVMEGGLEISYSAISILAQTLLHYCQGGPMELSRYFRGYILDEDRQDIGAFRITSTYSRSLHLPLLCRRADIISVNQA